MLCLLFLVMMFNINIAYSQGITDNNSNIRVRAAEEFVFRNGITFGDSIEEVKKKETLKTELDTDGEKVMLITEHGIVDGIPGCCIAYTFDEAGLLFDILVSYRETSNDSEMKDNDYSALNKQYRNLYGEPIKNVLTFEVVGSALRTSAFAITACKYTGGSGWSSDLDGWIIEGSTYNIKVEQVNYICYTKGFSQISYGHMASFTKYK